MSTNNSIAELTNREYRAGFVTDIESESVPPGLNEDIIRLISAKKQEPEFLLEWRLKAYRHWLTMKEPTWAERPLPAHRLPVDRLLLGPQAEEGRPEEPRRGRPRAARDLREAGHPPARAGAAGRRGRGRGLRQRVASPPPSRRSWPRPGVIFCSFSEAVHEAPRAGARSTWARSCPTPTTSSRPSTPRSSPTARFCYIPKGVRCPMELSTYFRINAANTGQFERTLIVAEEGSYVSYLEGCTAPIRDENQLHAAVVELVALRGRADQVLDGPELVPRRQGRQGRHLQLRHQARASARGRRSQDLLDAGRDRLRHHLEVPELHPAGRRLASASSTRWR